MGYMTPTPAPPPMPAAAAHWLQIVFRDRQDFVDTWFQYADWRMGDVLARVERYPTTGSYTIWVAPGTKRRADNE